MNFQLKENSIKFVRKILHKEVNNSLYSYPATFFIKYFEISFVNEYISDMFTYLTYERYVGGILYSIM